MRWPRRNDAFETFGRLDSLLKLKVSDLDDASFREMQSMISFLNKELRPIAAAVSAFEKTEEALVKKYPNLKRVRAA